MADLDAAQRQIIIDSLAAWLQENLGNVANDVRFQVLHGVEANYRDDLLEPRLATNGTATLTVLINGGARNTQVE